MSPTWVFLYLIIYHVVVVIIIIFRRMSPTWISYYIPLCEKIWRKKYVKFCWGVLFPHTIVPCIVQTLFSCLVQYFADLALQQPPQLQLMDKLVPHLYELCQGSQVSAAQVLVDQITERQQEFQAICDSRKGRGLYPALDTVRISTHYYALLSPANIGSLIICNGIWLFFPMSSVVFSLMMIDKGKENTQWVEKNTYTSTITNWRTFFSFSRLNNLFCAIPIYRLG